MKNLHSFIGAASLVTRPYNASRVFAGQSVRNSNMNPTRTWPVLAAATLAVILNSLLGAFAQPIVTTLPASGVTSTSATFNGSVNPNGSDTGVYYSYGL